MDIQKAHLYIEKYSRYEQELLLDFVKEDEFLYFRNRGDYAPYMHLSEKRYEPTMLLIHGCVPMRKMSEGAMLTVNMDRLLSWRNEIRGYDYYLEGQDPDRPAVVYLETNDGEGFAELIDDTDSSVSSYIRKEFVHRFKSSGGLGPCALKFMGAEFELRIWNVGQGNTNSISDRDNLTLFDFGASVYYSQSWMENIIKNHEFLYKDKNLFSLIISHWDVDHYNLLCAVDDSFLKRICCAFFPQDIITLTAKQVATRLSTFCKHYVVISPAKRAGSGRCGIQVAYSGCRYSLFKGEKCKSLNRSGLLLALYGEKAVAMLTADHSNYQIWDKMYTSIKIEKRKLHVVVPHHGGNCGKTAVRAAASPGIAAISVGSNGYGHPLPKTLAAYRNADYHVKRTDQCGHDIIIKM